MNRLTELKKLLHNSITVPQEKQSFFFKTGPGEYAEHDRFLGITMPTLRKIAQKYAGLTLEELLDLLHSPFNEERLLALIILVNQYSKASSNGNADLYQFYLRNIKRVNNWNLVDSSAHLIIGAHEFKHPTNLLLELAQSPTMWERRIAIVATWYFIKKNELAWTFKLAKILLHDDHDLMHKATGWMLREAGKRNQDMLLQFLDQHVQKMPRTMLRYAIEKFPEPLRKSYLKK